MHPHDSLTPKELRSLRHCAHEAAWTDGAVWARAIPTQEAFAVWLGIAPNTQARMERGELPIRPPMARLAIYVTAERAGQPVERIRQQLDAWRAAQAKPKESRSKPTTKKKSERKRAVTRRRS